MRTTAHPTGDETKTRRKSRSVPPSRDRDDRQDRPVSRLQRRHGNQGVQRLVEDRADDLADERGDSESSKPTGTGAISRAGTDASVPAPSAELHRQLRTSGGGRALDSPVRSAFESGLGYDLSGVRVHDGPTAAHLNEQLDAHAFTHGRDIYFGAGNYRPETPGGRHLLAHELVHTVQQKRTGSTPSRISQPDAPHERQAERAADRALRGRLVGSLSSVDGSVVSRYGPLDFAGDVASSAWSSVKNIGYGVQRGVESVGLTGLDRSAEIGSENERAFTLLQNIFKYGTKVDGPLYRLIETVVEHQIHEVVVNQLTPQQRAKLEAAAKEAGMKLIAYVLGKVLGKKVIKGVVTRIVARVASTTLFKRVATQLGISAGTSSSLIGIPIGGTMMLGIVQRASNASRRLGSESPRLYRALRRQELDMGYFLVESKLGEIENTIRSKVGQMTASSGKTSDEQ